MFYNLKAWYRLYLYHHNQGSVMENPYKSLFVNSKHVLYKPCCKVLHKILIKKVQVGNDQEKAQSERNSHSKNRDGKN